MRAHSGMHENTLLSFGGFDGADSDELWSLDTGGAGTTFPGAVAANWALLQPSSGPIPGARCRHFSFVQQQKLFVYGGWSREGCRRDLYSLDMEQQHWHKLKLHSRSSSANFGPHPRRYEACAFHRGVLWVFGGWDGGEFLDDLFALDMCSLAWRRVPAQGKVPSRRCYHSMVGYGGALYVFGGSGHQHPHLNDLYRFDIESERWKKVKTFGEKPRKRYAHSAVVTPDGRMAVFGGCCQQGVKYNDLFLYDFNTSHWTRVMTGGMKPSPRSSHAAAVCGMYLYIYGGYDGKTRFSELFRLPILLLWSPSTHKYFEAQLRAQIKTMLLMGKRQGNVWSFLPTEVLFVIFRFLCMPPAVPWSKKSSVQPAIDGCE